MDAEEGLVSQLLKSSEHGSASAHGSLASSFLNRSFPSKNGKTRPNDENASEAEAGFAILWRRERIRNGMLTGASSDR